MKLFIFFITRLIHCANGSSNPKKGLASPNCLQALSNYLKKGLWLAVKTGANNQFLYRLFVLPVLADEGCRYVAYYPYVINSGYYFFAKL